MYMERRDIWLKTFLVVAVGVKEKQAFAMKLPWVWVDGESRVASLTEYEYQDEHLISW